MEKSAKEREAYINYASELKIQLEQDEQKEKRARATDWAYGEQVNTADRTAGAILGAHKAHSRNVSVRIRLKSFLAKNSSCCVGLSTCTKWYQQSLRMAKVLEQEEELMKQEKLRELKKANVSLNHTRREKPQYHTREITKSCTETASPISSTSNVFLSATTCLMPLFCTPCYCSTLLLLFDTRFLRSFALS